MMMSTQVAKQYRVSHVISSTTPSRVNELLLAYRSAWRYCLRWNWRGRPAAGIPHVVIASDGDVGDLVIL